MVEAHHQVSSVAQVIQLAVAPVFLLAGVGALLAVLTNRLGRVIDRFHVLDKALSAGSTEVESAGDLATKISLSRRAKLIHWANILCTVRDLLVCLVVVALFVGAELRIDLSSTIAVLFVAAMASLIAGLACFLREIALATSFIENLHASRTTNREKS